MPILYHNIREETQAIQLENKKINTLYTWDDLSESGKIKLITALKTNSPIFSVRLLSKEEIRKTLEIVNPIIFRSRCDNHFGWEQFPVWRAKKIARAIYYLCRRRELTEQNLIIIKNAVEF